MARATAVLGAGFAQASVAEQKTLLVWTVGGLPEDAAAVIRSLPQVQSLTLVRAANTLLVRTQNAAGVMVDEAPAGTAYPVETMLLDPATFPAFVPPELALLFADLAQDEAILGRSSATLRRLSAGGSLEFADGSRLVVRAVVDDAVIGGAELVVIPSAWALAGVTKPRHILLTYDGVRSVLESAIRALLPARKLARFLAPGEAPILRFADAVLPQVQIKLRFGEFSIRLSNGARVVRDEAWIEANLVTEKLPILGEARCHRVMMNAVRGALQQLLDAGLAHLVDPAAFRGCDNPRRIRGKLALSRHAWGAAIDLDNGAAPLHVDHMTDPRFLTIMSRWGLTSGHTWLIPDPGHFEYYREPEARSR